MNAGGMDGEYVVQVDLTWAADNTCSVDYTLLEAASFEDDPAIKDFVYQCYAPKRELAKSMLYQVNTHKHT